MAKIKALGPPREYWRQVSLGDDGDFKVHMRRPSFDQFLEDEAHLSAGFYVGQASEASRHSVHHRLKTAIIGWDELYQQNGKGEEPLPFSWENLQALCTAYPQVFRQLALLAAEAYAPVSSDALGNSDEPASESSAD